MKCPKCGNDVKKGEMFCPNCMEEIPWVAEYNTVETIFHKHEASREKRIQTIKSQIKEKNNQHSFPRGKTRWCVIVVLFIFSILSGMIVFQLYKNQHSYIHQYESAQLAFNTGEYEKALEKIDRAIDLDSSRPSAYCLLAEALWVTGDTAGAVKVVETRLNQMPDSTLIYEELISLYLKEKQPDKIKKLLDHCQNAKIKSKFKSYITLDPVINYETGSYGVEFKVKISGKCWEYYYTLDGSKPNLNSQKYETPVEIKEGTTELNVVGYNSLGIPSDVLYRKYIVSLQGPDAPVILPEEEIFHENTQITINVPEGCDCYYSFDSTPTASSTTYTGPIAMPEGTHSLYAFLVGGNGKESDMAVKTYTLNY